MEFEVVGGSDEKVRFWSKVDWYESKLDHIEIAVVDNITPWVCFPHGKIIH